MADTAEVYGRGRAESIVGTNLPAVPVMTKIMPWMWRSPCDFDRHLERSLARLKRPSVSMLMLHFPARSEQHQWLGQLAVAIHNGRAEAVGLSNHTHAQLREAISFLNREGVSLSVLQAEVSLMQSAPLWDGRREICEDHGVALMAFRVFGGGTLFRTHFGPGARVKHALSEACRRTGGSPAQVTLAWLRHHRVVPIVGTCSVAHLDEALSARDMQLPEDVITLLDRACLPA